jgi:hypothetical protein
MQEFGSCEKGGYHMDINELSEAAGRLADEYRYTATKKGFH